MCLFGPLGIAKPQCPGNDLAVEIPVCILVRVSTDEQDNARQISELEAVAARADWRVLEVIRERLKESPATVVWPGDDNALRPVAGALLFALGGSTTGRLMLPSAQQITNVRHSYMNERFLKELRND